MSWAPPSYPPGWYPDPADPDALRWWDGRSWTATVARRERDRFVPLPFAVWWQASLLALAFSVASLLAALAVVVLGGPDWLATVASSAVLYSALVGLCRWFVDYHDRAPLREALGLRFRAVDAGWGALGWLTVVAANAALLAVFTATGVPYESNVSTDSDLDAATLAVFAVVAVVVAPVIEELFFRGLLLRSLASRLPPWAAITVQAVIFGLNHLGPGAGVGSIGLVILLSSAGAVFGGYAYRTGRLGAPMVAHAIMNAIAVTVVLVG